MNQDAEFYAKRSEERFAAGDVEGGYADLDQAILLAPDNLEYRWIRGDLRYQGDEYQLAIEDFSKISELSSDREDIKSAYHLMAVSHEILGLHGELVADLDWLIAHNLADALDYSWRGHYKCRSGDFEEAIEDFTRAHQISPATNEYLIIRAETYDQLGRYEDEIKDLTDVITSEAHPSILRVIYLNRAIAFFKLGNREQAFADFDESVRLGTRPFTTNAADYFAAFA